MVFFNYSTMQMVAKIVYYGPGLCGKTTNLNHIYEKTSPKSRGEMVSLATETDRTLFFDLLPLDVGLVGGFKTKFQLYTVPGQVFYNMTRKLVLKGVDGIVFVADSQVPMLDANIDSVENLRENLGDLGLKVDSIPVVFQFNKRDLPNITPVEAMNEALNLGGFPFVEASALNGEGVFETLKEISKLTLVKLRSKVTGDELKQNKASVEFKVQGARKIRQQIEREAAEGKEPGLEKTNIDEGSTEDVAIPADESLPGMSSVPEVVSFEDYDGPQSEIDLDADIESEHDNSLSSINFDMIDLDDFEEEIDNLDRVPDLDDTSEMAEVGDQLGEIDFEEDAEPTSEYSEEARNMGNAPEDPGEASETGPESQDEDAQPPAHRGGHSGQVKSQSVDALLNDLVTDVQKPKKAKGDRHHIKLPKPYSQAQVNCIFLDDAGNVVHSKLLKVNTSQGRVGKEIRLILEIDEG